MIRAILCFNLWLAKKLNNLPPCDLVCVFRVTRLDECCKPLVQPRSVLHLRQLGIPYGFPGTDDSSSHVSFHGKPDAG